MEIVKITENKKQYLDLLLEGDEQEDMIDRYLDRGDMFALFDGGQLRSVCVVVTQGEECELKNIATWPDCRGRGYGRALVDFVSGYYKGKCRTMAVGTGDTPPSVSFYERCGFRYSHRVKDFFKDNYDHPMMEHGILLCDMVYLEKEL